MTDAVSGPERTRQRAFFLLFCVSVITALGNSGMQSVLPEVHRVVVDVNRWMTDAQFTQAYTIALAAPGPNMLMVTIIGWHVALWAEY